MTAINKTVADLKGLTFLVTSISHICFLFSLSSVLLISRKTVLFYSAYLAGLLR